MDSANFFNSIKNIAGSLHCPSCGGGYSTGEIRLHAKNEDGLVFAVHCKKCNLPVWVNVVTKGFDEVLDEELSPISVDEVIDFHLLVRKFDGDFRKVFS